MRKHGPGRNLDLELALRAAEDGASVLIGRTPTKPNVPSSVSSKSNAELQTNLDLEVEGLIVSTLTSQFPDDTIVAEERGTVTGTTPFCWYIDPIDGTTNLVSGRPEIAISIARYNAGRVQVAVLSLPLRDIVLEFGLGYDRPLVNGKLLRPPPGAKTTSEALVGFPSTLTKLGCRKESAEGIRCLAQAARGIRIIGAVGYELGQVALGELDARFSFSPRSVDVAAGAAIVAAGGGTVTDIEGEEWTTSSQTILVARTRSLHRELLSFLNG